MTVELTWGQRRTLERCVQYGRAYPDQVDRGPLLRLGFIMVPPSAHLWPGEVHITDAGRAWLEAHGAAVPS